MCLLVKNFIAKVQPLNVFLSWKFFTHNGFSRKGTLRWFPLHFLLFIFFYTFKDHPTAHISLVLSYKIK